ncbi:MAG: hypothetical protein JXA67_17730, partial [Micromonosporaceae bacterium]|nr:hypothetical protein [Micromonosporaceae bacterium]
GMGAPLGARRFEGETWPSSANDEVVEALVPAWGESGRSGGEPVPTWAAGANGRGPNGWAEPQAHQPRPSVPYQPGHQQAGGPEIDPYQRGQHQQPEQVIVPQPATVPIPPEALLTPEAIAAVNAAANAIGAVGAPQQRTMGRGQGRGQFDGRVPVSGAPVSGLPISGVPAGSLPVSGVPASGIPISGAPISAVPVSGSPASGTLGGSAQAGGQVERAAAEPDWANPHVWPDAQTPPDRQTPPDGLVGPEGGAEHAAAAGAPTDGSPIDAALQPTRVWRTVEPAGSASSALPLPGPAPVVADHSQYDQQSGAFPPYQRSYPQSPYQQDAPAPDPAALRYLPAPADPRLRPADESQRQPSTQYAATSRGDLPRRVPSRPDVPGAIGAPGEFDSQAEADLDRIVDRLSDPQIDQIPADRREGFDIPTVLDAVRGVEGVRDAHLRPSSNGAHTLRLDLADDADAAEVSRIVARLLKERMGLAAEPNRSAQPSRVQPPLTAPYPREAQRRRAATASQRPAGAPYAVESAPTQIPPRPVTGIDQGLRQYGEASVADRVARPSDLHPDPGTSPAPRAVIDQVKVTDEGLDAVVEVRLVVGDRQAVGVANGPAFDGYVLRLAAAATAAAVDHLLGSQPAQRARCFVEHAMIVSLGGGCDVAVVVVLLAGDGWVDHLAGSALVMGDPRYAVVRATLSALNRRLEAML